MTYQYSDNYVQRPRRRPNLEHVPEPEEPPEEPEQHEHHEHHNSEVIVEALSSRKEYRKFFYVIGVIALCATIMSMVLGFDIIEWMRWFMAGTFVIFGSFKLIGYEAFVLMFPSYDILAKRFKLYNYFYPFLELFLGFLYAADLIPRARDLVTFVIMAAGAYSIIKVLPRSQAIRCACLGNIIKLPLSTVSLYEDVAMAAMAALMFVSHFIA